MRVCVFMSVCERVHECVCVCRPPVHTPLPPTWQPDELLHTVEWCEEGLGLPYVLPRVELTPQDADGHCCGLQQQQQRGAGLGAGFSV